MYDLPVDSKRMEMTAHGTFDFPVAVYENRIGRKELRAISWHWHEEFQFCYVIKGEISFFLNQRVYRVKKGNGIFINSEVMHMAKDTLGSDGAYVCIDFHPRIISSFPNSIFERRYVSPVLKNHAIESVLLTRDVERYEKVLIRLEKIKKILEAKEDGYEFDFCCELYIIWKYMTEDFRKFYEQSDVKQESDIINRRLRKMILYIRGHYQEKIKLDDIAKHLHLSSNECCRFFRKNMHCTIFDYICEYRITQSMRLLDDTSMSVAQIAYETGFGSSSYYIEKFKGKTGMTPVRYRRKRKAEKQKSVDK